MTAIYVRPEPVPVPVGPVTVTVPGLWADRWIEAVSTDMIAGVLPGMLDADDTHALALARVRGHVTGAHVQDAALQAVKDVSGRPWWEAVRLTGWALAKGGETYGHLVLAGVDPTRVTYAAWCSAVLAHIMTGRDEKERTKVEFSLMIPPPGFEEETDDWDTGIPEGFSADLPAGTS